MTTHQPLVVLVTGASSGIGRSISTYLGQKGCLVYGTARNPEAYAQPEQYSLLALDVQQSSTIDSAVNHIIALHGRIDVLINNAGVGITGPVEHTPLVEIDKVFDINLKGPIRLLQAVLPHMRNQGSGLVINITSIAGSMGLPFRGLYSATKSALSLVTESLRMECAPFGVKLCTVAPGDYATNIASGRYHSPLDTSGPYHPQYDKTLEGMNAHVNQGSNPDEVAHLVWKIMQTKQPKVHYRVGKPLQKAAVWIKYILPDTLFERLLLKFYA